MTLKKLNLDERMKHYHVAGLSLAFINKGQISRTECYGVLEAGTDRNVTQKSLFNACSISKFLTSMLVMVLTEEGILDLDADVNERLSSWKIPNNEWTKKNKVTLRRLLSHQAGMIDPDGSFFELNSYYGKPAMIEILNGKTAYCQESIRVMYEPGSNFQYSDAGYCIIQLLIEEVMGKPFKDVVNERLFEPLHMENSTYDPSSLHSKREDISGGHNKNGEIVENKYSIYPYPAASGLWSTPSDLGVLLIELINSLKGESKIGLSPKIAKEMISPQGCKDWTGLGLFLDGLNQNVEISSLGWGIGFQCMLVANPYDENGLVIMTNTDLGVHQMKGIIGEIYQTFTS